MIAIWQLVLGVGVTAVLSIASTILAVRRFSRVEIPVADAGVIDTLASAKLKEAQATEVIAEAFTNTLSQVRQLAEDRAQENKDLRHDLSEAEKKIDGLEADVTLLKESLDDLRHALSPRGEHGDWDARALQAARCSDPGFPAWPPTPS